MRTKKVVTLMSIKSTGDVGKRLGDQRKQDHTTPIPQHSTQHYDNTWRKPLPPTPPTSSSFAAAFFVEPSRPPTTCYEVH
ncbi:hypothetical protein Pcinc_017091 [Petrolisthes cinctipes]|uniref:Uncharacterized protein n=1 Tax=Petrolisthes cinctipes TaxID=88211 RepID=A0AAE1KL48_PETCI|nr:hypothetical protein Pcinc_017091 [Petrolisthes cinctipes]